MARGRAFDEQTKTWQNTFHFHVDLVVAGYPCKTLSALNSNGGAFSDPSTTTGHAQQAIMQWVQQRRPPALLFENVAQMTYQRAADNGEPTPLEQQHTFLHKLGYTHGNLLMNTCEFALPQSRPRQYMFYFLRDLADATQVPATIKLRCRCRPVLLARLLPQQGNAAGPARPGRAGPRLICHRIGA